MKKPKQKSASSTKSKAKKSKPQPKKKGKVMAVAAPSDRYKVELEMANKMPNGTTEYTYTAFTASLDLSQGEAEKSVDELKSMGCGGRLVLLDGTPEGKITLTWGSVAREAEAEKLETAALKKENNK